MKKMSWLEMTRHLLVTLLEQPLISTKAPLSLDAYVTSSHPLFIRITWAAVDRFLDKKVEKNKNTYVALTLPTTPLVVYNKQHQQNLL